MAELRLGGRCQRHPLNILPCEKCAVEQPQILTLRDVLRRLHAVIGDGTQKAAAEKLGVSQQYLSDVLNEAREPGPLILSGLGIERVVIYRDMRNTPGVPAQYTDPAGRADWVGKPGASLPHESPSGGKGEAAGTTRQTGETPVTTISGVEGKTNG